MTQRLSLCSYLSAWGCLPSARDRRSTYIPRLAPGPLDDDGTLPAGIMSALTVPKRKGLSMTEVLLLSATAVLTLIVAPSRAATIIVNNQSQFDAAVATATETGHADTIHASMAGPLGPGSSLTLPGAATSINLE